MYKRNIRFLTLAVLFSLSGLIARAANTLKCTVTQQDGLPAEKVELVLTGSASDKQWKKKTNDKGEVEFKGLPDGTYRMEGADATMQGYLLTKASGIELSGDTTKTCTPVFVSINVLNQLLNDSMQAVRTNKLDVAVEKAKSAIAMAPTVAEAHNMLAVAYAYSGNEADATAAAKKAAELNPEKFQPMISKIQLSALDAQVKQAEAKKDLDGMLKLYERMLGVTEEKATVYFNMATAYGRFNKYEDALKYIDKAIALDPADAEFKQVKIRLQDLYLKSTEKGLELK